MQESQYLSVCVLGDYSTEFLKEFSQALSQHECQTLTSHAIQHGTLLNASFLISASWDVLSKLETKFKALTKKFSYEIMLKRTNSLSFEKPKFSYFIYVICVEDPQAFYQLMRYLHQQQVEVIECSLETCKTRSTQTSMTNFTIHIRLPAEIVISEWRERFTLFCDDMNFDAVMEPEKG